MTREILPPPPRRMSVRDGMTSPEAWTWLHELRRVLGGDALDVTETVITTYTLPPVPAPSEPPAEAAVAVPCVSYDAAVAIPLDAASEPPVSAPDAAAVPDAVYPET